MQYASALAHFLRSELTPEVSVSNGGSLLRAESIWSHNPLEGLHRAFPGKNRGSLRQSCSGHKANPV